MRVIARDETKHSALSWEVAAWVEPLLSEAERRAVATDFFTTVVGRLR